MKFENLSDKSRALFGSFCEQMSKVSLREAVALPVAIGVCAVLYGVGVKPHGGYVAFQAYKAMSQTGSVSSLSQYVSAAGGTFVAAKAVTVLMAAGVVIAHAFQTIHKVVSNKLKGAEQSIQSGIAATFGGSSIALQSVKHSAAAKLDNAVLARIAVDQGKDLASMSIGQNGAVFYRDGDQLLTLCQKGSQYWNAHEAKEVTQRVIGQPMDLGDDDHGASMRPR